MLHATLSLFATVLSAQLEEKPLSVPAAEPVLERGSPALFSWGDADGDARLDLAAVSAEGVLQLLANVGEGRFEDVTERSGLAGIASAALAQWVDYDADGRLDLFVGAREGASRLFHNEGGEFVDMTAASGLVIDGALHSAHWLDHDGDGRIDLHVVAEKKNQIFRGLAGGSFERAELPAMDRPMTGPLGGGAILVPGKLESPEGGGMLAPDRNQTVVITGRLPVIVSPPGLGGGGSVLPAMGGPSSACIPSVTDQANPSTCLFASSSPTLGRLYPISSNLFVAVSGEVGIGTTSPTARLEVAGTARVTDTLTLAPAGDTALDVSTGSIYKGGSLFIHTKGGVRNTALGREALSSVTTGYGNTASGYRALRYNTSGVLNMASGDNALRSNTTGSGNTAGGAYALWANTTGSSNTASGSQALFLSTTGHSNTACGAAALRNNTTGNGNTASGRHALSNNTTGFYNTASGYSALRSNTTGYNNTASGSFALRSNTTGSNNTASGLRALYSNTTGARNTANGYRALDSNTIGYHNTASGVDALRSNTTGYRNTASGAYSLRTNTTGSNNTASGIDALRSNTTGNLNTASGATALRYNTTGTGNTAGGAYALRANTTGSGNTASGSFALLSNTTSHANTACGGDALRYNTTGNGNTASGRFALRHNTAGFYNTASGYSALRSNTTGYNNTASGSFALRYNTTGISNTASGNYALHSNTGGSHNSATGRQALRYNTTGSRNTASGVDALRSNTTGNYNTASGYLALRFNSTGSRNIALGHLAGYNLTTGSDNIAIGSAGVSAESATIRVGTAGTHTRAFVAGIRGVTTGGADGIPVLIDSAGQLGTVSSSRRFKEEIVDMGDRTERLLELRPVVFRYKPEVQSGERPLEYGLIAEEVAEVFPELVVHDEDGKPFTVKYHLLSAMLLNELKETDERVEAQARELEELHERFGMQEARLAALEGERAASGTRETP